MDTIYKTKQGEKILKDLYNRRVESFSGGYKFTSIFNRKNFSIQAHFWIKKVK